MEEFGKVMEFVTVVHYTGDYSSICYFSCIL